MSNQSSTNCLLEQGNSACYIEALSIDMTGDVM